MTDMHVSPELLFKSVDSQQGDAKQCLLREHKLICPRYPSVEPAYRTTWEQLQDFIAQAKMETTAHMRQARVGREAADTYEHAPVVLAAEVFCPQVANLFAQIAPWHDATDGFDSDIFIVADDPDDLSNVFVHVELFPRIRHDEQVDAYTSLAKINVPLALTSSSEGNDKDEGYSLLGTLIWGEQVSQGSSLDDVHATWLNHLGCWYLDEKKSIYLFLNRVFFSLIEYGRSDSRTVVSADVTESFDGSVESAALHFTPKSGR